MPGEIRGPVCRLLHEFDVRADRILGSEALQHQLAASDHDGEQVVEVMRDATRHLADHFHFLRLMKRLLRPPPVCLAAFELHSARGNHLFEAIMIVGQLLLAAEFIGVQSIFIIALTGNSHGEMTIDEASTNRTGR